MCLRSRLLEIGCSTGLFLNEIRKHDWDVEGIEPEEWSCSIARDKYGLNVVNSMFQDAGIEDSSCDAVLMIHVIEHLPDPCEGLSGIARMIRPGGILVLETPRFDTIWFKLLRGRERSVIEGHKHYFTRKTMMSLADKAGFDVLELDSVGRTLTLDRLCYSISKVFDSAFITRVLTSASNVLHLDRIRIHINLRDMMRLYLRKRA